MARVLIVEDDKMNAKLFDALLRKRGGFEVTLTEDVNEILAMAQSRQVDLIILDVALSNSYFEGRAMSGLSISRVLKEDPRTADIPVILATAHAMSGDRERFLEQSKADDYFAKPIMDPNVLIQRIHALIQKNSTQMQH